MDKIRVGDKVKVTCEMSEYFGERGVVVKGESCVFNVMFDRGGTTSLLKRELEKVEEEMEYEVGKPYLWFGGECPLPEGTKVKVRFGNKDFSNTTCHWDRGGHPWNVEKLEWQHTFGDNNNIVMFEIVEYPKSTRKVEMDLTEEEITTIKSVLGKVNL